MLNICELYHIDRRQDEVEALSKTLVLSIILRLSIEISYDGVSPSGKAAAFGAAIRRFESCYPSQLVLARGAYASRAHETRLKIDSADWRIFDIIKL